MQEGTKNKLASVAPIGVLGILALSFWIDVWNRPLELNPVVRVDSSFAEPATVRLSASELYRLDGDVSMFSCYACHDQEEQAPELSYDEDGRIVMEEHSYDFELEHGSSHRNENCYTCHDPENLEMLKLPDGTRLTITESNLLCGSCHGTLYNDWEIGVHGRMSGFWNADLGPARREDCTSCHNAHSPAFPSLKPYPAPQPLRALIQSDEDVPADSTDEFAEDS